MNLNMNLLSTPNSLKLLFKLRFSILLKNVQLFLSWEPLCWQKSHLTLRLLGCGVHIGDERWLGCGSFIYLFCTSFSSHVIYMENKQTKKKLHQMQMSWFGQCVLWSPRQGDGLIPSISAAICWLFWEGSSWTVSRAVSPRLSFMLTSIPRKAHQVDQWSEHFQVSLDEGQIPGHLMLPAARPTFFIQSHLIQLFMNNSYICNQWRHTYIGFKCSQKKSPSREAREKQSQPWHAV